MARKNRVIFVQRRQFFKRLLHCLFTAAREICSSSRQTHQSIPRKHNIVAQQITATSRRVPRRVQNCYIDTKQINFLIIGYIAVRLKLVEYYSEF